MSNYSVKSATEKRETTYSEDMNMKKAVILLIGILALSVSATASSLDKEPELKSGSIALEDFNRMWESVKPRQIWPKDHLMHELMSRRKYGDVVLDQKKLESHIRSGQLKLGASVEEVILTFQRSDDWSRNTFCEITQTVSSEESREQWMCNNIYLYFDDDNKLTGWEE